MAGAIAEQEQVSNIETRALTVCQQAKAVRIETDEAMLEATAFLNEVINALIREGDELFDPMIASAYKTHQLAISTKRKAVGGLAEAKLLIRNELARYAQVLDDRARAERLRMEREAQEAEARRVERELEAVEAGASWPEDKAEEVQAILEAPRPLVLPPQAPAMTVPGARDVYKCVVFNERLFYASIGDGRTPTSLAKPDQAALDRRASADKDGFKIPGCRVETSKAVSSGPRRR
jgi:hypothetical protein